MRWPLVLSLLPGATQSAQGVQVPCRHPVTLHQVLLSDLALQSSDVRAQTSEGRGMNAPLPSSMVSLDFTIPFGTENLEIVIHKLYSRLRIMATKREREKKGK